MRVRVLRGRVVIRESEPPQVGRIVVPQNYYDKHRRETKSHRGTVLALGAPQRTRKGVEVPPGFAVGDTVHYVFALAGSEEFRTIVWVDGKRAHVMVQEEVLVVEYQTVAWRSSVSEDHDPKASVYFEPLDELEASR